MIKPSVIVIGTAKRLTQRLRSSSLCPHLFAHGFIFHLMCVKCVVYMHLGDVKGCMILDGFATCGFTKNRFHKKGKEETYALHNRPCSDSALAVWNRFIVYDGRVYPHPACHCHRSCSVAYHQRPKAVLTPL